MTPKARLPNQTRVANEFLGVLRASVVNLVRATDYHGDTEDSEEYNNYNETVKVPLFALSGKTTLYPYLAFQAAVSQTFVNLVS